MTEQPYQALVIGAGAAGLAAARRLHDAGKTVLILEARNRVGGRIHTDATFTNFPLELGAEFIHGENAATHALVQAAGLRTIPVIRMPNLWWGEPARPVRQLPAPLPDTIRGLLRDYAALEIAPLESDVSLAAYLQMRGWNADALALADVLLAQTCCARLDSLSASDVQREMRVDHAGDDESRIHEGYAALLDWYQRELTIRFDTAVTRIEWNARGVTVRAVDDQWVAETCIITVPVSLLQRGVIAFNPPLPAHKQAAILAFRTEPATKLIYKFRERLWPDDLTFMGHEGVTARWWTPAFGREGEPVIVSYITADRARHIDALPETEALSVGLDELSALLGIANDEMRAQFVAGRRVSWAADPFALGGYAHIPPSQADARPALAQPTGDVLFFAGEATAYDTNSQTVHGALESGWRAAQECLSIVK